MGMGQIDPAAIREISKRLEQDWSEYQAQEKDDNALIIFLLALLVLVTLFVLAYPVVMVLGAN